MNKKLEKVLKELEELDKTFLIKGVPEEYKGIWVPNNEIKLWSIPRRTGELLKMFVLACKPRVILELGTSAGYSALWLASAAETYKGKVYTVELTEPKFQLAKSFIKKAGFEKSVQQIKGSIKDVLKTWTKKIDFVFLDADKPNYKIYLKLLEPHLAKNAIIIADNATDFAEHMKDYLSYLEKSPQYQSLVLDMDHGLSISVKTK